VIDLSLLRKVEFPRPSRVDGATYPTGGSHQGGLWFQAAIGGLPMGLISGGVVLLENAGIVILQNDVPLWVDNLTCTPVSMNFDRRLSSTYCCHRELAHCHE
jgi:hypothetical protein